MSTLLRTSCTESGCDRSGAVRPASRFADCWLCPQHRPAPTPTTTENHT